MFTTAVASGSYSKHQEDETELKYRLFFESIMPPGWKVVRMQNHVFPYAHIPLYSDSPGFMISIAGPIRPDGEQEGITLWFMPTPYWPTPENMFRPVPQRLGANSTHAVFYIMHNKDISSWMFWGDDLIRLLKLNTGGDKVPVVRSLM
jgi:hypothetical protein